MQDKEIIRKYADVWASDMEIKALKSDGITNIDVINQSIEMILATTPGTRLFNLSFGSRFSLRVFDLGTPEAMQRLLADTVKAIERWEDRILILKKSVEVRLRSDDNTIELTIPYFVKETQIPGVFSKIIRQ